jgi:hypothetical protein
MASSNGNSERGGNGNGLKGLTLKVAEDKLSAYLIFPEQSNGKQLDPSEVINVLEKEYRLVQIDKEALSNAIERWNNGDSSENKILIAQGNPPLNGQDGSIEWSKDYFREDKTDDNSGRVDFFNQIMISVVDEGEVIASIIPPTKGLDGEDVYGNEIPAKDGAPPPVEIGENIAVEEDGTKLVSKAVGQIILKNGRVSIKEVLEIDGNVDYEVGKVDFPGTIIVKGNVLDGFTLKAGEELHVYGLVEAANLESGGDMYLKGGAAGKSRGKIVCGGNLYVKYLDNIVVEVQGDVEIKTEAVNCLITTQSEIVAPAGSIIGGELWTTKGGEVGILGSDGINRTKIYIGRDPELENEIKELSEEIKSLKEKIKGSEGSVQSGDLKSQLELAKAKRAKLWDEVRATRRDAVLIVRKAIYQGVVLYVGGERKIWDDDYEKGVKIMFNPETYEIEFVGLV